MGHSTPSTAVRSYPRYSRDQLISSGAVHPRLARNASQAENASSVLVARSKAKGAGDSRFPDGTATGLSWQSWCHWVRLKASGAFATRWQTTPEAAFKPILAVRRVDNGVLSPPVVVPFGCHSPRSKLRTICTRESPGPIDRHVQGTHGNDGPARRRPLAAAGGRRTRSPHRQAARPVAHRLGDQS
jgi:hypothetical protein